MSNPARSDGSTTGAWIVRALARVVVVRPEELGIMALSFLTAFATFCGYMILRPVRETMGLTSGVENLPLLFWGTFVAMLAVQPVYGWLTSRYRRAVFLPWVYVFFAVNLMAFWAWFSMTTDHVWLGRAYYIWVSVFNLFVVAVFWSLMADIFSREQAGRMFGFIAAGLSAGALGGSRLAVELATPIGTINLLLVAAGFLVMAIGCLLLLLRVHRRLIERRVEVFVRRDEGRSEDQRVALGGSPLAAFRQVLTSPYLLLIALFVFLLTWASTFLYLEQAELVNKTFASRDERTEFFGKVDFWVQAASFVLQMLIFGRLFRWVGFRTLIVSMPLIMALAFVAIAVWPGFWVVVAAGMLRRIGEYGITRPCRDMLWTVVPREEKYKAKALIDTFVYRGGDAVSGSIHKLFKSLFDIGPVGVAWLGAGAAVVWAVVAWRLGGWRVARGGRATAAEPAAAAIAENSPAR